ncbi:MAG: histidinol-phosphate transaminase [Quisquiliibacterium sp.]|jgi:histidinol-phosphate aminotransferase
MSHAADRLDASSYVERVLRADVRAMSAYHVPDSTGLVKLDAMENPYQLPQGLRDELGHRLAQVSLNRYPVPSYAGLKQAIAARFGVPAGFELVLGNGSDELISMLSVAIAQPGARVLAPAPSFVMYEVSARLAGCGFIGVPLAEDFSLDLPAMLAAIRQHRPAVVYLAYPNNPTGNCFDDGAIEAILREAPGAVVLDEAYQPFAANSWMARLPEYPNLILMRTVSKLGLAGIRLGYLAGARAWTDQLEKVRPPYNINVLTETAALFAIEHADELDAQAARIRDDRQALAARLAGFSGVSVYPSQANFLLVRVVDGPATWRGLLNRRVLVKDVGKMHPLLANCLRLTIGTPAESEALVGALSQVLAK